MPVLPALPARARTVASVRLVLLFSVELVCLVLMFLGPQLRGQLIPGFGPSTSVDLGTVNVCRPGATTPAPCSVTVDLVYDQRPGLYDYVKVSTLGISDLDFHYEPSDNACSSLPGQRLVTTADAATCTVRVKFTPTHVGGFKGAVQLAGETGKFLQTTFLYGVGKGSQVEFDPNSPKVVYPATRGIGGFAQNSRGDLYIAAPADRQIILISKLRPNGAGFNYNGEPTSPVLDGGGNLYFVDQPGKRVLEYPQINRAAVTLPFTFAGNGTPGTITVDGQGNLYATQSGSDAILKLPFGSTTQQAIPTAAFDPDPPVGIQADAAGNLFISKHSGVLVEAPAGGGPLVLLSNAFHSESPYFTLDGIDDILNPQKNAVDLLQFPASGKPVTALTLGPITGYPFPLRAYAPVATLADPFGNVYVSDIEDTDPRTLLFRRDGAAPVNFGIVPVSMTGTATLRIFDGGNAPLVAKPVFNNASYQLVSTSPQNCLAGLPSAQYCTLTLRYTNLGNPDQAPTLTLKTNGLSDPVISLTANGDVVSAPLLSIPSGVYADPKTVSIYAPTAGSRVFYTTDGSLPTTSSIPYTGPITVSASQTVEAIAVAGQARSQVALGFYTITPSIYALDLSKGFSGPCELGITGALVSCGGSVRKNGTRLRLTDNHPYQAGIVFGDGVSLSGFTTYFTFQLTDAVADGFTFLLQAGNGSDDPGHTGKSLGFEGIAHSAALKFDLFSNAGEGNNSVGLFYNGALPTTPAVDLTGSGIDLHSGHVMLARVSYDGAKLELTLTDTASLATWTHAFPTDFSQVSNPTSATSFIPGFTAATGSLTAIQEILNWTYVSATPTPAPPAAALPALPNFPNAFNTQGVRLNGSAAVSGAVLQLTDGNKYEAGSAFYANKVPIQAFSTDFVLQMKNAVADGLTFVVQGAPAGPGALGGKGLLLGSAGIPKSVALKFDLYNNAGEGSNSTGLYLNGASPTSGAINLAGTGIDLHSADPIAAHVVYDGSALTLTLTDLLTHAAFTHSFSVDIPAVVGGSTAYVGFTGGTGMKGAVGQVLNWTFQNQ